MKSISLALLLLLVCGVANAETIRADKRQLVLDAFESIKGCMPIETQTECFERHKKEWIKGIVMDYKYREAEQALVVTDEQLF